MERARNQVVAIFHAAWPGAAQNEPLAPGAISTMRGRIYAYGMIRCAEARWFAWYRRLGTSVATGGGAVMLAGAGVAHDAASVPLLVIGGGWLAIGVASLVANPRYVREIVIDGNRVRFISPRAQLDVDCADIIEVRHRRGDFNRMGIMSIRTSTHGTIKAVPRLVGLIDVLVELRRLNPHVTYRNI